MLRSLPAGACSPSHTQDCAIKLTVPRRQPKGVAISGSSRCVLSTLPPRERDSVAVEIATLVRRHRPGSLTSPSLASAVDSRSEPPRAVCGRNSSKSEAAIRSRAAISRQRRVGWRRRHARELANESVLAEDFVKKQISTAAMPVLCGLNKRPPTCVIPASITASRTPACMPRSSSKSRGISADRRGQLRVRRNLRRPANDAGKSAVKERVWRVSQTRASGLSIQNSAMAPPTDRRYGGVSASYVMRG